MIPTRRSRPSTRVLELAPDDVPALIWLGRLYLDQGQADKAEPLFERARQHAPQTVAVLLGLGQAALARKDSSAAVSVLEEALRARSVGGSVHRRLAMAYAVLATRRGRPPICGGGRTPRCLVADPVRTELDLSLQSGLSFELRGVRALERGTSRPPRVSSAKAWLTDGSTALGRSLRHKLGTALFLLGDLPGRGGPVPRHRPAGACQRPRRNRGQGALQPRRPDGIGGARAAGDRAPDVGRRVSANYVEALLALADALRRQGRVADSLGVIRRRSGSTRGPTRLASAMAWPWSACGGIGRPATWFEDVARQPSRRARRQAGLARLLAAAPDDQVRDGARGLGLVQQIMSASPDRTTALWETFAMATGRDRRLHPGRERPARGHGRR